MESYCFSSPLICSAMCSSKHLLHFPSLSLDLLYSSFYTPKLKNNYSGYRACHTDMFRNILPFQPLDTAYKNNFFTTKPLLELTQVEECLPGRPSLVICIRPCRMSRRIWGRENKRRLKFAFQGFRQSLKLCSTPAR